MSKSTATYNSLVAFDIDPVLALEASNRYADNIEAAADWCFGAGQDVRVHLRD
jgi:hypothetical protein